MPVARSQSAIRSSEKGFRPRTTSKRSGNHGVFGRRLQPWFGIVGNVARERRMHRAHPTYRNAPPQRLSTRCRQLHEHTSTKLIMYLQSFTCKWKAQVAVRKVKRLCTWTASASMPPPWPRNGPMQRPAICADYNSHDYASPSPSNSLSVLTGEALARCFAYFPRGARNV